MRHFLMSRRQMTLWCAALALGFLLCGAAQAVLAGHMLQQDTLRLHVRAESDSILDQTRKLQVRDAVLALADAGCPDTDKSGALAWAAQNLPRVQLEAQCTLASLGCNAAVRVRLVNMYFDTTSYPGAALPAGRYDALRVELGDTQHYGKNWWCVLYPGLCRSACGGYALPEENDIVCGNAIVRFKLIEWVQRHGASRADHTLLALF